MTGEIAGRLKQRIRLERPAGSGLGLWMPAGDCWAEVRPAESLTMSALDGDTRLTARRWLVLVRSGIRVALDMRILWRGLDLRVTGVEADPRAPDRLLVVAEEMGP